MAKAVLSSGKRDGQMALTPLPLLAMATCNTPMKHALATLWTLCLSIPITWSAPVITEIVPVNIGGLEDKDGDFSPWVELYNPGDAPIELKGYHVTDDTGDLTKYTLPKFQIPAQSYRLLYLSGKDFFSLFNAQVHTSFKFGDDDTYFALVDPDGNTVVDSFEEIEHSLGASYGRVDPDGDALALFRVPTPNAPNRNPMLGVVADTRFSTDRGFYDAPFQVEITTATQGAKIIYTTSGQRPSAGALFTGAIGQVYAGPITISETTVLRVAAFKDGYAPSNVDTQTYIFPKDVVQQPEMRKSITEAPAFAPKMIDSLTSIPSLSLAVDDLNRVTGGSSSGNDVEYLTSVEILHPGGERGFQVDAGVSRFGGYFTNFAKKNFRLYFRARYGASKLRYPLYRGHEIGMAPVEQFDAINLRSGSHDMVARGAYLSNRFADDTLLEMGHIAPHGRFVHVYFNGYYWGQYHLRERWNAAMFSSYFGGKKDDYEAINANNAGSEFQLGQPYDGSGEFWDEALTLSKGPTPFRALQNHIDMGSYLCFQLAWLSGNCESEFQSAGSRLLRVPFKFYFKDGDGYLRPPGNRFGNRGPGNILRELQDEDDPELRMLLADTIHKHYFNGGAFTPERNIARLQRRIDETQLSFIAEAGRWNYRTPTAWQRFQDDLIEDHFPALTKNMIRQFKSLGWYPDDIIAPSFSKMGGAIEPDTKIFISAGSIFNPQDGDLLYTTDGSDPRLPGGELADSALIYDRQSPGIILHGTTALRARTLDPDGQWSPLTEAIFHLGKTPGPGDLILSELLYHPPPPTPDELHAGFESQVDFEFIELYNPTNIRLSLLNLALVDGVRFDFSKASVSSLAPKGLVVIAANADAFQLRYGTGVPLIGQYDSGRLNNAGETVRLSLKDGRVLLELDYDDEDPWPAEAGGSGKSLTLKEPASPGPIDDPSRWRASVIAGGTPGYLGSDLPAPSTEDADHDGLPAFAEAALGSSDRDASSGARLTVTRAQGAVTVTLPKASAAPASQFQLETSEDMTGWTTGGFTLEEPAPAAELLRWISHDHAVTAKSFVRVKITAP